MTQGVTLQRVWRTVEPRSESSTITPELSHDDRILDSLRTSGPDAVRAYFAAVRLLIAGEGGARWVAWLEQTRNPALRVQYAVHNTVEPNARKRAPEQTYEAAHGREYRPPEQPETRRDPQAAELASKVTMEEKARAAAALTLHLNTFSDRPDFTVPFTDQVFKILKPPCVGNVLFSLNKIQTVPNYLKEYLAAHSVTSAAFQSATAEFLATNTMTATELANLPWRQFNSILFAKAAGNPVYLLELKDFTLTDLPKEGHLRHDVLTFLADMSSDNESSITKDAEQALLLSRTELRNAAKTFLIKNPEFAVLKQVRPSYWNRLTRWLNTYAGTSGSALLTPADFREIGPKRANNIARVIWLGQTLKPDKHIDGECARFGLTRAQLSSAIEVLKQTDRTLFELAEYRMAHQLLNSAIERKAGKHQANDELAQFTDRDFRRLLDQGKTELATDIVESLRLLTQNPSHQKTLAKNWNVSAAAYMRAVRELLNNNPQLERAVNQTGSSASASTPAPKAADGAAEWRRFYEKLNRIGGIGGYDDFNDNSLEKCHTPEAADGVIDFLWELQHRSEPGAAAQTTQNFVKEMPNLEHILHLFWGNDANTRLRNRVRNYTPEPRSVDDDKASQQQAPTVAPRPKSEPTENWTVRFHKDLVTWINANNHRAYINRVVEDIEKDGPSNRAMGLKQAKTAWQVEGGGLGTYRIVGIVADRKKRDFYFKGLYSHATNGGKQFEKVGVAVKEYL